MIINTDYLEAVSVELVGETDAKKWEIMTYFYMSSETFEVPEGEITVLIWDKNDIWGEEVNKQVLALKEKIK